MLESTTDTQPSPPPTSRRVPSPAVATLLSFLWPGLGQAYRGRRRRALLLGLPVVVLFIGLLAITLIIGPLLVAVHLLNPQIALAAIGLITVLGLWRAVSIVDAARPGGRASAAFAVVLLALVVASHAWLAGTAIAFYQAGQLIYDPIVAAPQPSLTPEPGSTPGPGEPVPTGPLPSQVIEPPIVTPAPALPGQTERVTVLFIGADNTHGERLALTDTLIVASFDPVSHSVSMISIPRDTAHLPYYRGGEFAPRINTLVQTATRNPEDYPDGPLGTIVNEVSYLIGIRIDYYARIDISGFTRLIDLVGGVDVVAERPIADPTYQFLPDEVGFYLEAGPHHLDGKLATAYARSRHGSSDYQRARRQQQILLALRARLGDPLVLANLPGILGAVAEIVRTDAPLDRLPEIVSIVLGSDGAQTQQFVLSPPKYAQRTVTPTGTLAQTTTLDMDAVAELSIQLFGDASRYATVTP